ncbi:MAG: DUF4328 domain-containing protein [Pseudonocardia sp.]
MTTTPQPAEPTPPAATAQARPVDGPGAGLTVVLVLGALLITLDSLSVWGDYAILSDLAHHRIGQELYADRMDAWNDLRFPIHAAVYVVSGLEVIVTAVWVHRARTNAGILAPHQHFRYSPGFCAGAVLVPVANLWWTPRILADICTATGLPGTVRLIRAWWGVYVAGFVLEVGSLALPTDLGLIQDTGGHIVSVAGDPLSVAFPISVLGTVALVSYCGYYVPLMTVVGRVSARQTELLPAPRPA